MNPFPAIGATVGHMQNAMAPTSLPSILPRRSMSMAHAEFQLGEEWNTESPKIGIVIGVGVAAFAFFAAKAIRAKTKK